MAALIRLVLRMMLLRGHKNSKEIRMALRDQDILDATVGYVNEQTAGALEFGDGSLLKWLWENREAILEFILTLIALFSQNGGAAALEG